MNNAWAFVVAAYAVVFTGTAGVIGWSLVAMRRAERAAERR